MPASSSDTNEGHLTGYGSSSYRHYVLVLLMLVYTLNFVDRTLIAVVAQPIIESFQLTDAQWGLLYGPPFAIFYAVMGPSRLHSGPTAPIASMSSPFASYCGQS